MNVISKNPKFLLLSALLAGAATGSVAVQAQDQAESDLTGSVTDTTPSLTDLADGPDVKGIISSRSREGDRIQIKTEQGATTIVGVTEQTRISGTGGLFGLASDKLASDQLLNGLPVTIKTKQAGNELLASQIKLQKKDLKVATMIYNGTDQRFGEQAAATEALRGRMGDIDKYNIKNTINVNFGTGQSQLSAQAKSDLCTAASQAEQMDNALLLVVGYTDSTGDPDFNQALSEKRAGRVVNYLQQVCKWAPYRMLSPTGMSEADPLAPNDTPEGKAQNRRVAVNVLVSKAVDGL